MRRGGPTERGAPGGMVGEEQRGGAKGRSKGEEKGGV